MLSDAVSGMVGAPNELTEGAQASATAILATTCGGGANVSPKAAASSVGALSSLADAAFVQAPAGTAAAAGSPSGLASAAAGSARKLQAVMGIAGSLSGSLLASASVPGEAPASISSPNIQVPGAPCRSMRASLPPCRRPTGAPAATVVQPKPACYAPGCNPV